MDTDREKLDKRVAELRRARSPYEPGWRSICDEILPYRARWSKSAHGKAQTKDSEKINSTPARALRIMVAGFIAGMVSPSREWFQLTALDKELNEVPTVKRYLEACERRQREEFAQSRFYQTLADGVFRDLGLIANAAMLQEARPAGGLRYEPPLLGSWWCDVNADGDTDTFLHEKPMTVRQLIEDYGRDACSEKVKSAWDRSDYAQVFWIYVLTNPNEEWQPSKADFRGMKFASHHWEQTEKDKKFLRRSGYHEFPYAVPRWNVPGGEVYGTGSPGWECVGDCKELQHHEITLAKIGAGIAEPPMRADASLRDNYASLLPADMTYVENGQKGMFEPAYEAPPMGIDVELKAIDRTETRINQSFWVDMWLSMIQDQRAQRATATEVAATRDEIMMQLGPVLERMNNDLLGPVINRSFNVLDRQGHMPEPPPELEDVGIKAEFISVMHQAQKMTGLGSLREFIANVRGLSEQFPEVSDKVNADAIVDELQETLGIRPELVRSEKEAGATRAARAEQQQAQDQGEAMLAATQGAKNLSGVDPQQLGDVAASLGPVAAAAGGLS